MLYCDGVVLYCIVCLTSMSRCDTHSRLACFICLSLFCVRRRHLHSSLSLCSNTMQPRSRRLRQEHDYRCGTNGWRNPSSRCNRWVSTSHACLSLRKSGMFSDSYSRQQFVQRLVLLSLLVVVVILSIITLQSHAPNT